MFMYPTPLSRVWSVLTHALAVAPLGRPGPRDVVAIGGVGAAAAVACVALLARRLTAGHPAADRRRSDAAAFCLGTLLVGVPAYVGFLMTLKYAMQPFYFLALLALAAGCLDGLWGVVRRPARRLLLTGVLCVLVVGDVPDAWANAGMRMSNVDRVAERLATAAVPGDLIVLTPYWLSSPFTPVLPRGGRGGPRAAGPAAAVPGPRALRPTATQPRRDGPGPGPRGSRRPRRAPGVGRAGRGQRAGVESPGPVRAPATDRLARSRLQPLLEPAAEPGPSTALRP